MKLIDHYREEKRSVRVTEREAVFKDFCSIVEHTLFRRGLRCVDVPHVPYFHGFMDQFSDDELLNFRHEAKIRARPK